MLILEALIALSLLVICIFPFIPKTSKKNLELKKGQGQSLFALDFQNRMCELREKAKSEGVNWIEVGKNNQNVFLIKERVCFKEFAISADFQARMYLLKIYKKKHDKKNFYRFKIEGIYRMKKTKHNIPFYYYITLEG